jgi:6-phosphogluconolactonase
MKITRRFFAFLALAASLAVLSLAGSAGRPGESHRYLTLVGTYTNKTASKGIYLYEFDAETGKLAAKGLAAETRDPSWLAVHPSGKFVYAANESGKQSAISAFALDSQSGKLTQLNQLPALGEDPCYLSFDKTGKYLFVANYTSGNVVVFPILEDGKLGEHTALLTDAGAVGPNKQRQEGPHAHWVGLSPGNRIVLVADLGLDHVLLYSFDPANGSLSPNIVAPGPGSSKSQNRKDGWSVTLSPGTGPRHVAFSRDNRFLYVLGELESTVTVFDSPGLDEDTFHPVQQISALPGGFSGRNDAAEIALHPSGKWLFTSNRGHDSITVFAVDSQKSTLQRVGDFSTGGKEPRHFAIDPTGRFLLAENQLSNSIVVFSIDPASGALKQVSRTEGVPSPVCLVFLPTP